MRIVTRPDFDGIVCAVIILEALKKELPIVWIEPSDVQNRAADIKKGDIMANLPFDERCSVWFDHHVSNSTKLEEYRRDNASNITVDNVIDGAFAIAPSAAGVVYQYYKERGMITSNKFDELIKETDIIDGALLSMDQVIHPENYPFILLSMTVKNRDESDRLYWDRLVKLLRHQSIEKILIDSEVKKRCKLVISENLAYSDILKTQTKICGKISITDFRDLERAPSGNRFLIYCLFPEIMANIKIRYDDNDKNIVLLSVGKSIFNDTFKVNIGKMLSKYGGGGHAGAGGCTMNVESAQKNIDEIVAIMKANSDS
ncbi:MAG: exopolyphosphatase [Desulfamplus sp.]|nr:exopolyphosphatase [Desulfamplus sp.]MBF0389450.1 exopolyphosphatase [Desulfamplus sp.]